jgi:hypothetical protein
VGAGTPREDDTEPVGNGGYTPGTVIVVNDPDDDGKGCSSEEEELGSTGDGWPTGFVIVGAAVGAGESVGIGTVALVDDEPGDVPEGTGKSAELLEDVGTGAGDTSVGASEGTGCSTELLVAVGTGASEISVDEEVGDNVSEGTGWPTGLPGIVGSGPSEMSGTDELGGVPVGRAGWTREPVGDVDGNGPSLGPLPEVEGSGTSVSESDGTGTQGAGATGTPVGPEPPASLVEGSSGGTESPEYL